MRDPVPIDPSGVPDAPPVLRLSVVRRRTGSTLVDTRGEVDLTTRDAFAGAVDGAIAASDRRRVIVDLSRCTFFAACGAHVLRRARASARLRKASLHVVVGGGPAAVTITRTVRLGAGLRPHHSVRAAEAVRGERTRRPHRADPSRRPSVPVTDRFDQVIAALERLAQGRFALCDVCGDEIDDLRLRAAADADRCALHPAAGPAQPA